MSPPQQRILPNKVEASHQFISMGIIFPLPVSTYCINAATDGAEAGIKQHLQSHWACLVFLLTVLKRLRVSFDDLQ